MTVPFSLYFDGHGIFGHDISNYAKSQLPDLSFGNLETLPTVKTAFEDAFSKTNQSLSSYTYLESEYSGTTASVCLVRQGKLYVGHVGDSRIVLGLKVNGEYIAKTLTCDHKPDVKIERDRIEAANGNIRKLPGDVTYRIYKQNGDGPGLSVTRAIGDRVAQTIGVTAEPEFTEVEITQDAEYLIVCSDGVWEFIVTKKLWIWSESLPLTASGPVNSSSGPGGSTKKWMSLMISQPS